MANYNSISLFLMILLLALSSLAFSEYDQIASLCVADFSRPVLPNGYACKNTKKVSVEDFFFSGITKTNMLRFTSGLNLSWATSALVPGLNSVGAALVRAEFDVGGAFLPHYNHGTEVVYVEYGTLEFGFWAGYRDLRLFKKVVRAGEVFVNPRGLLHYQLNLGPGPAYAIAAVDTQNINPVMVAETLFSSNPVAETHVLARTLRTDDQTIEKIKGNFKSG